MFRIAAYPKCFEQAIAESRTMSIFEWIDMAKKERLEVEGLQMFDGFLTSFDPPYLEKVKEAFLEAGFQVPMFMCSPDFTNPDPDSRKRAVDYEVRMIELAKHFGGDGAVCRVLSGQQYPEVSREQGVEWVVAAIDEVLPVARECGVVLGMENHYKLFDWTYPEFAQRAEVFLEIVNSIEERNFFGVQYDPSNAIVAGDDPVALLEAVQDRIVSMHASDRAIKPGFTLDDLRRDETKKGYSSILTHSAVGDGLNDYDRIFSILAGAGYDRWVTIEDGMNGIEEIQKSVDFLKQMQARYFR
jgi:sugar phosphate isomerase/epimerase